MLPTIRVEGDIIVQENLSSWRRTKLVRPLRRGDLITYTLPHNPRLQGCKRIVGLPGDVVCVDPSGVSGEAARGEMVAVPKGHLWVQGDNMQNSTDSRDFGPLPLGLVRGRPFAIVSLPLCSSRPVADDGRSRHGRRHGRHGSLDHQPPQAHHRRQCTHHREAAFRAVTSAVHPLSSPRFPQPPATRLISERPDT